MLSLLPIKDSTGTRWVPEFNENKKVNLYLIIRVEFFY